MIDISKIINAIGSAAAALGAQRINADAMAAHMRAVPVPASVPADFVDYGEIARSILAENSRH